MNNALLFNGKDNWIEVPIAPPTANGGAITIEFWNLDTDPNMTTESFMFAGTTPQNGRILCHAPWLGSEIIWDYGDWGKGGRLSCSYKPYLGKWTHIALVHSGKQQSPGFQGIYLDGKLAASKNGEQSVEGTFTRLLIGAGLLDLTGGIDHFNRGTMDGFRVWNRVRTQEEIARDMHAELIGDEPDLFACFNFNWGIANTAMSWLKGDPWKTLPNNVRGQPAGRLHNFRATDYVPSGVPASAPVGPVFSLTKDGTQYLTTSHTDKQRMIMAGWTAADSPAFYAYRAPAPGTSPLYRLYGPSSKEYAVTADPAERERLDPRPHRTSPAGPWEYDNELAYVSRTASGDSVPLYRYRDTTTRKDLLTTVVQPAAGGRRLVETVCHVLPRIDATYRPTPITPTTTAGLNEGIWYLLICDAVDARSAVALDSSDQPVLDAVPSTGDFARFQWQIQDGRLVNRAAPQRVLTVDGTGVRSAVVDRTATTQRWTFEPVAKKGTDHFTLAQGPNRLSTSSTKLSTTTAAPTAPETWTLTSIDLVDGRSLPGPRTEHSGIPYNKYLAATAESGGKKATVHVLGTGTVSEWAMLRVQLVVQNMMRALKSGVDVSALDGVEVLVISQDDSSEELDNSPCIGYLHTEAEIEDMRGGAHGVLCYVTEEMMWRRGTYNCKFDSDQPRWFDQVVHEFSHLMHYQLAAIDETKIPIGPTPTGLPAELTKAAADSVTSLKSARKTEVYAISVQSWFDSIAQTGSLYYPSTRADLQKIDPTRYAFLAEHFDPDNVWRPAPEPRRSVAPRATPEPPSEPRPAADATITAGWSTVDGAYTIRLDSVYGNLSVDKKTTDGTPGYLFGTMQSGFWTDEYIGKITFTDDGTMVLWSRQGAELQRLKGTTGGTGPFRLAMAIGSGATSPTLVVKDATGTSLYVVLPR